MTMPNSSHLPRIDIGHTTSSDNFSAALYSELANRTGAHEYPASPTATDESALADKPLVTPLRPNPHRLHSSRSRTSLKQCLNGRNPSSPVSPAHPKSPPLVIISSTPGTASGLLQPQRYSPISSPSVQASHLPPISGATVLSLPSYSPAHRAAMSSELALTRGDNKQTHVEPSNTASLLDSLPETSTSTQRFPALKSPTTERLHNDARPPAASRTLSEAAMATTTATRHEDKPKANSTDHPGNRRNVMSVDSPPASKDPRRSLDDHGPDASDTSSVADSEFKSARNSSGFVETLTDMDNGLSALFECTRQSLNSTKDVITFLRRRALIEETYCQGMLKLSQDMTKLMAKEGVRDGTYKKAWSDILNLHEMAALNHIRFGNHLLEMAEELAAQHRDKDRLRRQLKETAAKQRKLYFDSERQLEKTKDKYAGHSEDLEKVILKKRLAGDTGPRKNRSKSVSNTVAMFLGRDNANQDLGKAEQDARVKMEQSNDAYRTQLQATSSIRNDYLSVLLPSMLTALKSVTEECDLGLCLHLAKYARGYENAIASDAQLIKPLDPKATSGHRGLLAIVETIDNEADLAEHLSRAAPRTSRTVTPSASTTGDSNQLSSLSATNGKGDRSAPFLSSSTHAHLNSNFVAAQSQSHDRAGGNSSSSTYPPLSPRTTQPSLEAQAHRDGLTIPRIVTLCTDFIEQHGLKSEGIYRLSGQNSVVKALKEELDATGKVGEFDHLDQRFDVNNMSSFLKLYFRELPDGLIPTRLYDAFVKIVETRDEEKRRSYIRNALAALPKANYETLRHLMHHLHRVQEHRQVNMMSISNLSIVFGPTLVRVPEHINPISSMQIQCKIVEHILELCQDLFSRSPATTATDHS